MSRSVKCAVAGCPGVASIETNGAGGTVDRCPCCEKRDAWVRVNLPLRKIVCGICGGAVPSAQRGGTLRYCVACKPLVKAKERRASKQRSRDRRANVLPLRSA